MSRVTVTAEARYRCRGAGGRFETQTRMVSIETEQRPAEVDYADELFAEADANAPDNCESTTLGPLTISVIVGEEQEPLSGADPNREISVRGKIWFRNDQSGEDRPVNYVQNFPGYSTQGDVLSAMWEVGLNMVDEFGVIDTENWDTEEGWHLKAVQITEPTYWATSVGI